MSLLADTINDFIKSRSVNKLWFAAQAGASQNTVTRWLQDKNWPKEHIRAIQRVLEISDEEISEIARDWRQNKNDVPGYRIAGPEFATR